MPHENRAILLVFNIASTKVRVVRLSGEMHVKADSKNNENASLGSSVSPLRTSRGSYLFPDYRYPSLKEGLPRR
jgi:hypothetical protein